MAIQFDVKSAQPILTENVGGGRVRLKGVLISTKATGVIDLKDGAGGNTLFAFNAVAGAVGNTSVLIPGDGIVFQNGIYVNTLTDASITVFYG